MRVCSFCLCFARFATWAFNVAWGIIWLSLTFASLQFAYFVIGSARSRPICFNGPRWGPWKCFLPLIVPSLLSVFNHFNFDSACMMRYFAVYWNYVVTRWVSSRKVKVRINPIPPCPPPLPSSYTAWFLYTNIEICINYLVSLQQVQFNCNPFD